MDLQQRIRRARGAVLIHVALILIAMTALSALAIDMGVNYVGRGQVQSAADAAALAAAVSRSFVDPNDAALAQNSGVAAARANNVWGAQPDVLTTDITFPACPAGAPGVAGTCVQAEVFRTTYGRTGGTPLPTFFARFVGVNDQGAKARALAQMRAGSGTADCVKPWGLPDKWIEVRNPADEFNRYRLTGGNRGQLLPGVVDSYDPAQGYALPADYGRQVTLYIGGNGNDALSPGFFQPVVVDPGNVGGSRYRDAIVGCVGTNIGPGTVLQPEPGRMVGPTTHGFEDLIALDPSATWSTTENRPVGGCMAAGTCTRSPRWIAVPVFNIDTYEQARLAQNPAAGRNLQISVVKIIGLWLNEVRNNNDITGYITHYPTLSISGNSPNGTAGAFSRTVILVR